MTVGEKALYKVTLSDYIVNELELDSNVEWVKFEIVESGAFNYGNHTATVVSILPASGDPERSITYDTRYFIGSIEDVAETIIEEYYGKNLKSFEKIEDLSEN